MPPPIVQFAFDYSPLVRAMDLALRTTTRSLPKFLGSTGYRIAWKAGKYTPAVPISRMDAELDAQAEFSDGRENTMGLTVGQAIVLARMNPNSRYNRLTDNRWAIPAGALNTGAYGHLARNVFFDRLEGYEERQKAGRHSSGHFVQSGWKAVKRKLRAMGFMGGPGFTIGDGGDLNTLNTLSVDKFGDAIMGGQGTQTPWLRIENSVGMEGASNLAYKRNQALHDYSGPALQRAMEEVAAIDLRDWNLRKNLAAEIVAAWESVPDARPQQASVNHSQLEKYVDEEMAEGFGGRSAVPWLR